MNIHISPTASELGKSAAQMAENAIKEAISTQGFANIILATGASQFDMLAHLVASAQVDWSQVRMFHLDEYLGLSDTHKASFRKYLKERFVEKVSNLEAYHFIDGEADPREECARLNALIQQHPIDVAMIGIGENGHLAFNDPPADIETEIPYIVVELDEACRLQQVGEGWFANLEAVPKQAISMSIRHILKSQQIICSVPDLRKAQAVKGAVEGKISPDCPASMLQLHTNCHVFLDSPSASLLSD